MIYFLQFSLLAAAVFKLLQFQRYPITWRCHCDLLYPPPSIPPWSSLNLFQKSLFKLPILFNVPLLNSTSLSFGEDEKTNPGIENASLSLNHLFFCLYFCIHMAMALRWSIWVCNNVSVQIGVRQIIKIGKVSYLNSMVVEILSL